MVYVKRRRGIGIKSWIIEALTEYALEQSADLPPKKRLSHTTVANKIWRGRLKPIDRNRAHRCKENGGLKRKGVSMPEWLWLAIKAYAEQRGKGESNSLVASRILLGKIPPVPKDCVEAGERQAQLREGEREPHGGKEPPKRDRSSKAAREAQEAKREAENELKKLEREAAKREREKKRAQRAEEKAARAAEKKRAREENEAAKEAAKRKKKEEQNGAAQEELKEGKLDERGIPLSKGHPIDEEKDSKNRTVNPDDDFFGGVFNM